MGARSSVGTSVNIVFVGGVWCVLAYALVKINAYANTMHLSQDAMNTIYVLDVAFIFSPVLIIIAYLINHWLEEKSEANMGM